jgi:glycosyltransferase involved in cell wall biosynthesis
VVCSRVGGIPEVVRDGVEGFLAPARDTETMASRTIEILKDPGLQHRMGQAARARALSEFCSTKIIPLYENLYQRVLEDR